MKDLSGIKFSRLLVLGFSHRKNKNYFWLCQCDCGTTKVVASSHLKTGHTSSCGCFSLERTAAQNVTHGMSDAPEFEVWMGIKRRCLNPNEKCFHNYGGRGIKVCERWLLSFEDFYLDMGSRPSPKHTIERVDTDGNYEPLNCKWATQKEQANNRRNNRRLSALGKNLTVSQWSDETGITSWTILGRLKNNWSAFEAVTIPVGCRRGA